VSSDEFLYLFGVNLHVKTPCFYRHASIFECQKIYLPSSCYGNGAQVSVVVIYLPKLSSVSLQSSVQIKRKNLIGFWANVLQFERQRSWNDANI
jgi:hypothetical protein